MTGRISSARSQVAASTTWSWAAVSPLVIGAEPNRIELINFSDGVDFDECFPRHVDISVGEVVASVIGLDDLRANKRAVGRLQDLADIENLDDRSSGHSDAEN